MTFNTMKDNMYVSHAANSYSLHRLEPSLFVLHFLRGPGLRDDRALQLSTSLEETHLQPLRVR